MTIYKLRILPLFLLVIGLTTLTSGCKKKDMSLKLNEPRNIRGVVSYKRSFPDLNDAHLEVAKKIGIRPLADREAAGDMKENAAGPGGSPVLRRRPFLQGRPAE